MKDVVLIYSGGMDSSSALHLYKDRIKVAVSFNYGSTHNAQEIKYAALNCERLGIEHIIIDIKTISEHLTSALLGDGDIPHGHYEDATMKSTVVPFRNGIMLSIATGIAESNDCKHVMIASHKGDNAVYPDCRPEFNDMMNAAMYHGTYNNITLWAPFEHITKLELALVGYANGMVPEQTYSCYEGGIEHCGKCGTCVERQEAIDFINAHTNDVELYTNIVGRITNAR